MKRLLLICFVCVPHLLQAQNVGIGTSTPHNSAQLDISSSNKGLSIPSMTTTQRLAIAGPKAGLFVYDTNKQTLCMFNGTNWVYFQPTPDPNISIPIGVASSDGIVGDQFGYSVDMHGNYAVVGAPGDDIAANANQGSVYVFFYNGSNWVEQAKLIAGDGSAEDRFGHSVSIHGDYIIVGAPYDDVGANNSQGSAYIFIRSGNTWTQQTRITGGSATAGDFFGNAVSIHGDFVVVGAPNDNVGSNNLQGTAYFFNRSGTVWTQTNYVTIPGGAADDRFGTAVDLTADYAAIGAPFDDHTSETNAGSAHIFQRTGISWSHMQTLTQLPAATNKSLGKSVSIDGNRVVIGGEDPNSTGKAYVFQYNNSSWDAMSSLHLLLNANPQATSYGFGDQVSMSGNFIITGKWNEFNNIAGDGEAVLFETDGTSYFTVRTILNPSLTEFQYMGRAVAVSGNNCILGARDANGERGLVYFLNFQ